MDIELENVSNLEVCPVHQNQVAPDHKVRVVRRRRREHDLEFPRARLHLSLQPRGQGATNYELGLQSGREAIALGEAGREVRVMSTVPVVDVAVMVGIGIVAMFVAVTMTVVAVTVVVAIMFVVAIAIAVALSSGDGCGERQ
jgi:hypothetical protein